MPQTLQKGQDVTGLMSGQDVTDLMNAPAAPAAATPSRTALESVGAAIGGAAHELNPVAMVSGLYNAVRHPIDTVSNIGAAHVEQAKQAMQMAKEGRYSEAYGHAMATLIPILGPAAANIGDEIANTGDVARGVGRSVGLAAQVLAPGAVKAGVKAVRATGLAEKAAGAAEAGAASRIVDVMAPKVGANKTRFGNMAQAVAKNVAEEPGLGALSRQGLAAKVGTRLQEAESALDEASDTRNAGRAYLTAPIIKELRAKRTALTAEAVEGTLPKREVTSRTSQILDERGRPIVVDEAKAKSLGSDVVPAPNAARVAQIDKAIAELKSLGPLARYEAVRRIRQAYDAPARAVYHPSLTADFTAKMGEKLGAADVTGVLRDKLATFDPPTAAANTDYAIWRKASDVLEAAEEVQRTRPTVGRKIAARFAGGLVGEAASGPVGAAVGVVLGPLVDGALSSGVTTKVITARALTQLSKALRTGDAAAIEKAMSQVRTYSLLFKRADAATERAPTMAPSYASGQEERRTAQR